MRFRLVALLGVLLLAATACGGGTTTGEPGTATDTPTSPGAASPATSTLNAQVASFDLATGSDQRLTVGLVAQSPEEGRQFVVGGEIDLELLFLGQGQATPDPEPLGTATATFLPVPGTAPDGPVEGPTLATEGVRGVYEASVDLPEPGIYGVRATVELPDLGQLTAEAAASVAAEHQVLNVGDPAPAVDNPTADSTDVPPEAIDSRATTNDGQIPDPELHDMTVTEALESGRPTVIVVSTPVYCRSEFCGPITETVAELQQRYGDRANFIHLEVWRSFEDKELNPAAAEYIRTPDGGGNEPWTFFVGADGTIQARWDNVLDAAELEQLLEAL